MVSSKSAPVNKQAKNRSFQQGQVNPSVKAKKVSCNPVD